MVILRHSIKYMGDNINNLSIPLIFTLYSLITVKYTDYGCCTGNASSHPSLFCSCLLRYTCTTTCSSFGALYNKITSSHLTPGILPWPAENGSTNCDPGCVDGYIRPVNGVCMNMIEAFIRSLVIQQVYCL